MTTSLSRACRTAIETGLARHYGGFVLAGLAALATDTAVLALLTRGVGMSPFLSRPFGIALAMVVSWLINRTITFSAKVAPSFFEFAKFAGVSITSQVVNYIVFATLLLSFPVLMPEIALLMACFVSMFVSYAGFRFGVFRSAAAGQREGRQ
jgi:putative flippase GtrA